ncbi:MAG: DUF4389 domain-containing protein [Alphaproteobacteria bacterium]|nr:DUF4389 domain-containing protein [Alphaproteobacteria bacterium]
MSELNEEEIKKNVKDKDTWLRFVYLVVFGFAFYLSIILTFAVSIFQFLAKLFSGKSFDGLATFGANLATYQAQVTSFLTFASDEKPFPFATFPNKDHACGGTKPASGGAACGLKSMSGGEPFTVKDTESSTSGSPYNMG